MIFCAHATRVEEGELAGWSSPLLAEAAHADGAPSMRAVGVAQAALARKGVERKAKKALATGQRRVPARLGRAGEKERAVEGKPGHRSREGEVPDK